ncbi:hypothetical protein D9M73_181540 [compost metagenome]
MRAGFQIAERHGGRDQRGRILRIALGQTCALQHVARAAAAPDGDGAILDRAFGRFGERDDQVVRRHMPPAVTTPGDRRDRLRARFVTIGAGERAGHGAEQGTTDRRRDRDCARAQGGAGRRATPPFERTDPRSEIGHPIDLQCGSAQPIDQAQFGLRHDRAAERHRRRTARLLQAMIASQEQG